MNVIVTGARGYLGRYVVDTLRAGGCSVTALGREDGDLATESGARRALTSRRSDVVVNLAGPVAVGSESFDAGLVVARTHTQIALNVRRFAEGRIVHASSTAVYGAPRSVVTEQHARLPLHLYGLGKLLAEDVLDNAIVLRFGGLFSNERRTGALFHFCQAARQGTTLHVTTPVPTPWQVCHAADAADAIMLAVTASRLPAGPINIGYSEPIELGSIARRIAAIAGNGSRIEVAATHPVFQLDLSLSQKMLGWSPPRLDDRLSALYAGYSL